MPLLHRGRWRFLKASYVTNIQPKKSSRNFPAQIDLLSPYRPPDPRLSLFHPPCPSVFFFSLFDSTLLLRFPLAASLLMVVTSNEDLIMLLLIPPLHLVTAPSSLLALGYRFRFPSPRSPPTTSSFNFFRRPCDP